MVITVTKANWFEHNPYHHELLILFNPIPLPEYHVGSVHHQLSYAATTIKVWLKYSGSTVHFINYTNAITIHKIHKNLVYAADYA